MALVQTLQSLINIGLPAARIARTIQTMGGDECN